MNNKLHLNVNQAVPTRWAQDTPGNVTKANEAWPGLPGKTPKQTNG